MTEFILRNEKAPYPTAVRIIIDFYRDMPHPAVGNQEKDVCSSFKQLSSDSDHMQLNAATMKNLEILCNQTTGSVKGSLLWVLDHTQTPFGKRLLRKWMSQSLKSVIDIQAQQEAVAEILCSESSVLPSLQSLLTRLPDLERGLCSIYQKNTLRLWAAITLHSLWTNIVTCSNCESS
uniref:MutS homolog 3 (E. coli) n=1 Tax=Cyprinus carpio carpio TaxID=630221 RepID=A0A9J8D3R1_CYPCA